MSNASNTDASSSVVERSRTSGVRRRGVIGRGIFPLGKLAAVVAGVIAAWWAIIHLFGIDPFFMPGPAATFEAVIERRSDLASASWVTMRAAVFGLALSTVFAAVLAAIVVTSRTLERTVLPFAIVLRTIPVIALAPLITLIVGRGFRTSVVAVTIVTFFPIFAYFAEGLRAVSSDMSELMRLYNASFPQELWYVRIRVALPFLFAGVQDGARAAVLAAMLAELLTGNQGLGVELVRGASGIRSDLVWAVVVVATVWSIGLFFAARVLEREVLKRLAGQERVSLQP